MNKNICYIIRLLRCLFLLVSLTVISTSALAFYGAPAPADCNGNSDVGWIHMQGFDGCSRNSPSGDPEGTNLITKSTTLEPSHQPIFGGESYVPYSGKWKIRANMCSTTTAMQCTLSKTSSFVDTGDTIDVRSTTSLGQNGDHFRSVSGIVPANTSICYTLFDPKTPSVHWRTEDGWTCSDANLLPKVPADCYINGTSDLNIDLGNIERSDIPTEPDSNGPMAKSSSVSVLCTRDMSTSVITRFKYTSVSVSGHNLVSTGKNGLGVAIYYKGFLVENGQQLPVENFKTGFSYVDLTFVPVRDKDTEIKNIPTGAFKADAVMEMTEQ